MKNPFVAASPAERLLEDELYARVYEEIESGQIDKATQARAIEEGGSDSGAVKKAYIKHRIAGIKAEAKLQVEKERKLKKFKREIIRQEEQKSEKHQYEKRAGLSDDQIELYKKVEAVRSNNGSAVGSTLLILLIFIIFAAISKALFLLN